MYDPLSTLGKIISLGSLGSTSGFALVLPRLPREIIFPAVDNGSYTPLHSDLSYTYTAVQMLLRLISFTQLHLNKDGQQINSEDHRSYFDHQGIELSRKFWSGEKFGPGDQNSRKSGPPGPQFPEKFGPRLE